ncbi:MAG: 50S ribosomal protein L13 [Patescibacteria group bacterium]
MSETYKTKKKDIKRGWHLFDAEGKVLGRLASEIAPLLIGKHKPKYAPYLDMGDHVVVVNSEKFRVTGKKNSEKLYYIPSRYPGNTRSETLRELRARKPGEAIRLAVKRMLPKNRLQDARMSRLHIYERDEHPHVAQLGGKKSD